MDDLYLENIDEFVNDHNKIVTYKWLSLTLGVHVNQAKQMLYHYLDQKRKESSASQLHATYLVSGKSVENGNPSHKVAVVREEQLEDVKSKLELVVSIHVYSIQKCALKDSGPLYSTDYDAVKENLKNCCKYSAIRCVSPVEGQQTRDAPQASLPAAEASKPVGNGEPARPSKQAAKQSKGIMGMFANKSAGNRLEASKEVKVEVKEDAAVAEASKSKPTAKGNAMSHFFGKSTGSKPNPDEKSEKTIKEELATQNSSAAEKKSSSSSGAKAEMDIKQEEPRSSDTVAKSGQESRSKTKRLEPSDSEDEKQENMKKKRRRIKKPQPDSSDDEIIPDSPPMSVKTSSLEVKKEPVPLTVSSEGKRRKRRRVLKSNTFVDEDGCMVTEKGYKTESYSDSEDDFKPSNPCPKDPSALKPPSWKKEDESKSSKKATTASNKPTKQPSIMGFFQKK